MISPSVILTVDMDFPSPFSVRAIEVDVPAPVGVVRQIQKLVVGLELFEHPALSLRDGGNDIVRRHRPPDPLQLELADWLDLHGVLDLHQNSRADQDLSWLGLIAKTGGDIGHRADSGIVKPALEANRPERSKAVRNPDAEPNVVPQATPRFGQGSDSVTHFKRHEHSLKRRALYWHWIIKDHHHAVTGIAFERAAIPVSYTHLTLPTILRV